MCPVLFIVTSLSDRIASVSYESLWNEPYIHVTLTRALHDTFKKIYTNIHFLICYFSSSIKSKIENEKIYFKKPKHV